MTEQPGNPTDPTQPAPAASSDAGAAPTPPPAAPTPPAQSSAPAAGGSQYDFNQAKATLQGAHQFDLGIMAAGVIAWIAGFMPFYTASVGGGGFTVSAHASAYHGFFGWFAVWLALAGAVLIALTLFNIVGSLPMPLYQIVAAAFGLALLCLILALFVIPGGGCGGTSGLGFHCDTGHGFGYWLALIAVIAGLALSVLRMRESTSATTA